MLRTLALLPLLFLPVAGAIAAAPIPVFVLHSYSQEYPWTKGQHQGFVQTLNGSSGQTYSLKVEYLDTKRVHYTPAYAERMASHLRDKYAGYQPAAIYVTDDNALAFARSHAQDLFPGVPVFFSGVNDFGIKSRLDASRFTGVFERKEIAPNLRLMRRIDEAVRDIVIVGDASETDRAIAREIGQELARHPEIRATYLSSPRLDELTRLLAHRDERFVFLSTLGAVRDGNGRTVSLAETIAAIVAAGRFVVFSMEDAYRFPGVLGGFVTSGPGHGRAAAELVQRHLQGTPVSELPPVESGVNLYQLDEHELNKAGLALPAELAPKVSLVNPVPTFYDTRRAAIIGSLYALVPLMLASLVGSLLLFVRKNRQIARSSAHVAEVKESLDQAQRIAQMGNWDWHIDENRLFWSTGIYRLFQIEPRRFGASYEAFLDRVHPDDRAAVDAALQAALTSSAPYDIEHRIVLPGGEVRIVHQSAELSRDEQGRPQRMIGTVQDITERRRAEQALRDKDAHLQRLVYQDVLTGLPNRALLMDRVEHAIRRAERSQEILALAFVDLDRFKAINESLGHAQGDALLRAAAGRLRRLMRDEDTVARFGGDEFVVLLEDLDSAEDAAGVAERIAAALSEMFVIGGYHLHVSASIGIALYPQDGRDVQALMKNADAAMYKAKENGRDTFHFYSQSLTDRVMQRIQMEARLRSAFECRLLQVHYQPLVRMQDGRIQGVEALLRWNDPEHGPVPPDQFIPLAEDTGLIIPLGEWVVAEACQSLARWERAGLLSDAFVMHVNLSGRQLLQQDLPRRLGRILRDTAVAPERVVLELTETTAMEGEAKPLTALRELGVGIAIDDFGTGHSSLGRLKQLPIGEIKIDRSFIRQIPEDVDDQAIVRAIMALAASLELRVIAEGVEHRGQERFLIDCGCHLAQGYRYARPMAERDLLRHLRAGHLRPADALEVPGSAEATDAIGPGVPAGSNAAAGAANDADSADRATAGPAADAGACAPAARRSQSSAALA